MNLTLKRSIKRKICWWAYLNLCYVWMFSMQFITNFTIKTLFWEAEIFLNVFSKCRKCYFRDRNSYKNFLGRGGGMRPAWTPLTNSCLRYSAHTFGDCILCWGRARKWALWQFFPTTEESLKKCTASYSLLWIILNLMLTLTLYSNILCYTRTIKTQQLGMRAIEFKSCKLCHSNINMGYAINVLW